MNISNQIRNIINLNLTSFSKRSIVTYGLKTRSTISPVLVKATDFNKNVLLESEGQSSFSFENVNLSMTKRIPALFMQDGLVRTQISDPKINEKLNIGVPLNSLLINDFKLPSLKENNVVEPVGNVIKKEAVNMIKIRKRKIRKHKRKKMKRKLRTMLLDRKTRKRVRQNKELLAFVNQALEEGEKYNVHAHIDETLEKLKWKPPVTKARGRLAPQWVIENEFEQKRLKKSLNERIDYCSRKL